MTTSENALAWPDHKPTALLVLADGTVLEGFGLGAEGHAVGEVCFNTAMTGYEEILTDPSYAGQLITFTFPHIGNVGTNEEDIETVNMAATPGARGVILHAAITEPSTPKRSRSDFSASRACMSRTINRQRFIAVTSRQPRDAQGKLMPMGSRKRVGAEAATGEETKLPGEAHTEASEEAAQVCSSLKSAGGQCFVQRN